LRVKRHLDGDVHGGLMGLDIVEFGRLLAAKRGARGVRAAALEAEVSSSTYSRVENGHMPDLETFAKLCRWLDKDPAEFLGIEKNKDEATAGKAVVHFKKDKTVKPETAKALGDLILAAQAAIRERAKLVGR
jgi:transcriptional regulator with XRE-family HTH domain